LPVAPCLGIGADNELYNINADHMAAACAEFIGADQLIYLTDVAGVLDGERVLSAVNCEQIEQLVQCRVVSGGMILKLEAAKRAIEGGVRDVRIVGGTGPDALLLASRSAQNHCGSDLSGIPGTLVMREPRNTAQAAALSAA
jgi:acetylglutamate kinase